MDNWLMRLKLKHPTIPGSPMGSRIHNPSWKFPKRDVLIAMGLMVPGLLLEGRASAQEESGSAWDRFTSDVTYQLARTHQMTFVDAYARDPSTGRASSAAVTIDRFAALHGLTFDAAYSFLPWFGLGVEGSLHEDLTAPDPDPYLERAGVRVGAQRMWGIGVMSEFRPRQRTFETRHGLFLRAGLRRVWLDNRMALDSGVVQPDSSVDDDSMVVLAAGYRLVVGSGMTVSLQGISGASAGNVFVGVGLGGGIH